MRPGRVLAGDSVLPAAVDRPRVHLPLRSRLVGDTSVDSVEKAIRDLLEYARTRALAVAQEVSLSLSVMFDRPALVPRHGGAGWIIEQDTVVTNAMDRQWPSAIHLAGFLGDDGRSMCRRIAADLIDKGGEALRYWTLTWGVGDYMVLWEDDTEAVSFDGNRERFVAEHVLLPAIHGYLRDLSSLDVPDPDAAYRVSVEAVQLATSESFTIRTSLPICGVSLLDPPVEGNCSRSRGRPSGRKFRNNRVTSAFPP